MSAHKLNLVTSLQILLAFSLITSAVACGKKKKKAEGPCGAGVSQSACALQIIGHSAWVTNITAYEQDPKTKQTVPGSERKISVTYEFKEATPAPLWRRTMIIEAADGNKAMFQQGNVGKVTGNSIEFIAGGTSCDDASYHAVQGEFVLYYRRSGNSLKFDTQPLVDRPVRNIGDIFGNMFSSVIEDIIRNVLEQTFSFGSARTYLTSGHGSFTATRSKSLELIEAKAVEVGCFSTFGSGYNKSALRPEW